MNFCCCAVFSVTAEKIGDELHFQEKQTYGGSLFSITTIGDGTVDVITEEGQHFDDLIISIYKL